MTVRLIITFTAKEDKVAAFRDLLLQVKDSLPKVPGCTAVACFNSLSDSRVFTLVETWESEQRHKDHIEGVIRSGGWAHIATMLSSDPVSSYFNEL